MPEGPKSQSKIRVFSQVKRTLIRANLTDGRSLSASLREAGDENFILEETTMGIPTTIACSQVKEVNGRDHPLAAKVAPGFRKWDRGC
jgi:hypothetical protein